MYSCGAAGYHAAMMGNGLWDIVRPWQWVVLGCVPVVVFILAPWLLGLLYRADGDPPPGRGRRIWVMFIGLLATGGTLAVGSLLALLVLAEARASDAVLVGALVVVGVGGLLLGYWATRRALRAAPAAPRRRAVIPFVMVAASVLGIAAVWLTFLGRARIVVTRSIDAANVNGIGKALQLYHAEHGAFPDDLRRMVDEGMLGAVMLTCHWGQAYKRIPDPLTKPYDGPCEFRYFRLPDDAPEDLLRVWQSPAYHDGEGACVLLKSGHVQWVAGSGVLERVDRTWRWLAGRAGATRPAE